MKNLDALIFTAVLIAGSDRADTINFDEAKSGEVPNGWTATKTAKGDPKWIVEKDVTAPSKPNVLKQSGEATYPICIKISVTATSDTP